MVHVHRSEPDAPRPEADDAGAAAAGRSWADAVVVNATTGSAIAADAHGVGRPLADADTVFLDLDGCLWFGERLADGAVELVRDLRNGGRRVGFLTNASNSGVGPVVAKLVRLGIPATDGDVVMPVEVLAEHPWLLRRPRVWVLGPADVREAIAAFTPVAGTPEEAELLVLGRDHEMTFADLADALRVLTRGGGFLAFNVDPRLPAEGGRVLPGTGAIAAALTYASGVQPEVVGKPAPAFFEAALRRFGAEPARTVMVGDTLDSDIAGAAAAGMRTVLVGEPGPSLRDPAPVPDHRVADLRELRALLLG